MRDYDWKSASAGWYRRWRLAVNKAKEYRGTPDGNAYQFAAVIANAGYNISESLEAQKEKSNDA